VSLWQVYCLIAAFLAFWAQRSSDVAPSLLMIQLGVESQTSSSLVYPVVGGLVQVGAG
jgi:hypothetical protein